MEYNLFLPNESIIQNDDFSIYCNTILCEVAKDILKVLSEKSTDILDFFEIKKTRHIQINLYNEHDTFIKYTKQFFIPSSYCSAHFANNMLNIYINPENLKDKNKYNWTIKMASHEYVHLVYKENIQEPGNNRVVWFDEGLAVFLSGEKDNLKDKEKFKTWFFNKIVSDNNIIPKINFLQKHGSKYGEFVDLETHKYNGYDLSYLAIRYLVETTDKTIISKIMRKKDLINKVGENILEDAVSYYTNIFTNEIDNSVVK